MSKLFVMFRVLLIFYGGFCLGFILSFSLHVYRHPEDLNTYSSLSRNLWDIVFTGKVVKQANQMPSVKVDEEGQNSSSILNNPRVLCYLLVGPSTHAKSIHVKETWGKRCDRIIFFSTKKDDVLGTVALDAKEGYSYLWEKSQKALKHLYAHHPDFDWYLKADDDTFVIMENLKLFLSKSKPTEPVYYGVKFKMFVKQGFMSGGGGYVFSNEALQRISKNGLTSNNSDLCPVSESTGAEDVNIGKCFEYVGVKTGDSFDDNGRPRFFSHSPEALFFKSNLINHLHWYWKYLDHIHPLGPECCSDYTISFHDIKPRMMWALEMLLYKIKVFTRQFEASPSRNENRNNSTIKSINEVQKIIFK